VVPIREFDSLPIPKVPQSSTFSASWIYWKVIMTLIWRDPIVEMGLFMDSRGIPITMCLHSGNTSEQVTAVPLENEVLKMLDGAEFIYCADAGLGSYNIRKFNSMGGRSFIVTQSIKNSAIL